MQKPKRTIKSKEELKTQMVHLQKIERMKKLARLIWPFIENQKTIYDAQTVLNATAGFIKQDLALKTEQILVKDLSITLKEKNSPIKKSVEDLIQLLQKEGANDVANLLERMGNSLGQFSAASYMKNSMSVIKMDEFIA